MTSSPSPASVMIPARDWKPAPGDFLLGVTGHRDPVKAELLILQGVVEELLVHIRDKAQEASARLVVMCHLAEGADQICAAAAHKLGIPLVVPLPMEQADYEIDFTGEAELAEFRRALAQAREVVQIPPAAAPPAGASAQDLRNLQYVEAGQFLSAHCPLLLALWDGRHNNKPGGTGDVVARHLATERPDGLPGIVYHLLTPRASIPQPLDDGAEPYTLRVLTAGEGMLGSV